MSAQTRRGFWLLPLLLSFVLALLVALWGGLLRLGWNLPPGHAGLPGAHGPLMVSGFLGGLICLERAVGVGESRGYLVPALAGAGGIMLVLGLEMPAKVSLFLASLGLLGLYATLLRRRVEAFTVVMTVGAAAWGVGNLLWLLDWPLFRLVPWWLGFLILTIAGERLELNRFAKPSPGSREAFFGVVVVLLGGLLGGLLSPSGGMRLLGAGLLGLALWLFRYDIARRTVRQPGLPRFVALCLLSGYGWLGLGGVLGLVSGALVPGLRYDAFLHSLLLGFVFAMIFGHAPIIVPAVFRVPLPFHRRFYAHLLLLHVTLLVRVGADLGGLPLGRLWSGLLNEGVVLLFLASTLWAVGAGQRGLRARTLESTARGTP